MFDLVAGTLLSKVWRALLVAGAGLFAIELGPVVGLVGLMLFELSTTVMVARATAAETIPGDGPEKSTARRKLVRAAASEALKERAGVAVGLVFVVIYANTAGLDWVKGMMFMTVGAVLLTLAWLNLGRSNKLMRLLMRSLQKNLASRGIDINTDDEEGPTVLVDAEVHAVVHRPPPPDAPDQTDLLPAAGLPTSPDHDTE